MPTGPTSTGSPGTGAAAAVAGGEPQSGGCHAKLEGPEAALAMIEPLASALSGYFHFHGLSGPLLMQAGRAGEARTAFADAIALANTAAEGAHIRMRIERLSGCL